MSFVLYFILTISIWIIALVIYVLFENHIINFIKKITRQSEKSNCQISLDINIKALLNDPIFDNLFKKVKEDGKIKKTQTKNDWINKIIKNYQEKYNKKLPGETVIFNIKDNLLFKNNKIQYHNTIYHEIVIPYDEKNKHYEHGRTNDTLTIRALMINWFIKLQVWKFTKKHSHEVKTTEGGDSKNNKISYKTFYTLTSFPFMYTSQAIPKSYLNLNIQATDSYFKDKDKTDWQHTNKTNIDYKREWEWFMKEIKEYEYISEIECWQVGINRRKTRQIKDRFYKKSLALLQDQWFTNDMWRYHNKYLNININIFTNFDWWIDAISLDYQDFCSWNIYED